MDAQTAVRIHTDNSPEMTHLSVWIPTDNNTIQPNPGVVQFPPPPSTVMDRVTDRLGIGLGIGIWVGLGIGLGLEV